ncbi:Bcr/CflA family multidrug efflux MFS transporter [Microvirga sp. BT350]|uniref:Bcr/CflA family efflux transporter n=2 Tax=Microvirga alba TaxID=2791025 RepID=A0A931BMC9_9HYPH|nr:Bcr/CflA family multidrug efflux MFS transporter [Microvirga alba]
MTSDVNHVSLENPSRASGLRILLVLSALMAFASISTDIYLPAFPALATAFHTDPGQVQMTLSGFLVGFSLGQLFWGPIGDRYGRRIPIAIGLVLFMVGSAGCALSGSAWQMTGWRVVQAVGACAGPVLARAMVRDLYARERSAQMLSTLMLVMSVAPLLGPILGAQILAVRSWQAIFWTLAGFGLLVLVGLLALPETLPRHRRNPQRLTQALGGYLRLLRSPRLIGYAVSGGFFYGGIYAYLAGTPFAYINYYHVPTQAYGLLFGLNIIGMMVANLLNTRLVIRLGSDRIFRVGTMIAAFAGVTLALNSRFGWGGLAGLVVPLFLYVSMAGFVVANSVAGALAAFPSKAGAASALVGAMHYGTGVLSAAMIGWFADGTPWAMGWIVGLGGVGSFVSAILLVRASGPAT